ncbi:MAG: NUMOD3 domain-containing DNA-binding protein [bacterium]
MDECLICKGIFKSKNALSLHIKRTHNLSRYEYDKKFNLLCYCEICGKEINCGNKTKRCKNHVDRNKENNPFYGKSHSDETKIKLRDVNRINSKKKWEDEDYRNKVIKGISKPRPEKFKIEQSERIKNWYIENPNQKELRSEHMKKSWEEGKILSENFNFRNSYLENEFYNLLLDYNKNLIQNHKIKIGDSWIIPDIFEPYKHVIIEFFGDYFHCNPKQFYPNDEIRKNQCAKEIWEHDLNRIKKLEFEGYRVFIVWEDDFLNKRNEVLTEIKKII